jgi:hypothetical protein
MYLSGGKMICPVCGNETPLVEKEGRLQGFCKIKGVVRCVIDIPITPVVKEVSNPEFVEVPEIPEVPDKKKRSKKPNEYTE